MHPGFAYWWHARRNAHRHHHGHHDHHESASCGPRDAVEAAEAVAAHCGERGHGFRGPPPWAAAAAAHFGGHGGDDGDFGGGAFGVRRPLRFLAHKLDLRDEQVAELARILDDLKTERAQGAVDHRRTTASFADAIAAETFDESKVKEGADTRVKSAERLRDAVVKALGRIHSVLDAEQRGKLAYLLRTGALSM
jgi:Spy/CpxP family protein refolding chaperone